MPNTNLTEAQLAKLPKTVRQEIERLDSAITYWKAKAAEGPADSDTYLDRMHGVDDFPGRPAGKGTPVLFYPGDDPRLHIEVRVRDGRLRVTGSGDGYLAVLPSHQNGLDVQCLPYHPRPARPAPAQLAKAWGEGYDAGDLDASVQRTLAEGYALPEGQSPDPTPNPYAATEEV